MSEPPAAATELLQRLERARFDDDPEISNLMSRAAEFIDRAHAAGDDATACDLALVLVRLCGRRSEFAARDDWARRAVEYATAADEKEPTGRAPRAMVRLANALSWPKRSPAAIPIAEQALQLAEHFYGVEAPEVVDSLHALAGALDDTEEDDRKRIHLYDRAIRIFEKSGQGDDVAVVRSLAGSALARRRIGDLEAAEKLYRRAVAIVGRVHGPDDWRMSDLLGQLGQVLVQRGRAVEAVPLFERALRLEDEPGQENSSVVIYALYELASALRAAGRAADAVPVLDRAVRALGSREKGGLGIVVLTLRAWVLHDCGELDAAREVAQRVSEYAAKRWRAESESIASVREQLRGILG